MGCCKTSNTAGWVSSDSKICEAIESENCKFLEYLLQMRQHELKSSFNINFLTFHSDDGHEINILGYSLIFGKASVFKHIHKHYSASCAIMESYFQCYGSTGLHIICENNFMDLLEYYTPIYISLPKRQEINKINHQTQLC